MENLVIICDPGKALDDEEMTLVLSQLHRQGLANPLAIVANLVPAEQRAALMRGTLDLTGLAHVPVGVGSEVLSFAVQPQHQLEEVPYLTFERLHNSGTQLLVETIAAAADASVTFLLASAMTDAAQLLKLAESEFKRAVKSVVIMGGVMCRDEGVVVDIDGCFRPDFATNNHYDYASALFLYKRLQELGIPMVVLSRHAAHAVRVPSRIYHEMSVSGHSVGAKLAHSYHYFIDDFWRAVNAPARDIAHEGLPPRWDRDHFLDTFCDGRGKERTAKQSVFDLVQHAVLSDPMALVAAIPELRDRFYQPHVVMVKGTAHRLIGLSPQRTGVRDSNALASFLLTQVLGALSVPASAPQSPRQ